ncbi:MAG TPA: ATP-binding cassette domain-containing protein [Candidatus Eisenbacteria bacterium]|nr:ATP-binding cassette domain-containing protein [Candidatus Eisenbacteria bacterium]
MLEARGLAVGPPGGPLVLRDLDFALAPGEWVALTGANGGGKSLFCLALAGLLGPRAGSVLADGVALAPHEPGRRAVGMVFQEPEGQLVAPTLEEEIAFPLENLGWERAAIRERVRRMVEEFDLAALAGRTPQSLSGGEKSRLGLAAALAGDPRYLVLDEPGVYLDARARERLRALVRREVERGRGAVFVTQLEEEWAAADRRLRLERGRLAAATDDPLERDAGGLESFAPGPALLRARSLGFGYAPATPLVCGVDLEIGAGEIVLLTGASGAGKTTLLLLLAGVLEPQQGAIELAGSARLGVLLQSPEDQLVSTTVGEDVAMGSKRSGHERERDVRAALAEVGLDPAAHGARPPTALSHGERRRAAWAGLLAQNAGLWLLDEPSTGLDRAGVSVLETTLRRFASTGGAALVASQDPRLDAWRTRRYAIEDGHLTAQ